MCFKWYNKQISLLKKQDNLVVFSWVASKALFALGLGMLLGYKYTQIAWDQWGWTLIVISIIVGIPALKVWWKEFRKKR